MKFLDTLTAIESYIPELRRKGLKPAPALVATLSVPLAHGKSPLALQLGGLITARFVTQVADPNLMIPILLPLLLVVSEQVDDCARVLEKLTQLLFDPSTDHLLVESLEQLRTSVESQQLSAGQVEDFLLRIQDAKLTVLENRYFLTDTLPRLGTFTGGKSYPIHDSHFVMELSNSDFKTLDPRQRNQWCQAVLPALASLDQNQPLFLTNAISSFRNSRALEKFGSENVGTERFATEKVGTEKVDTGGPDRSPLLKKLLLALAKVSTNPDDLFTTAESLNLDSLRLLNPHHSWLLAQLLDLMTKVSRTATEFSGTYNRVFKYADVEYFTPKRIAYLSEQVFPLLNNLSSLDLPGGQLPTHLKLIYDFDKLDAGFANSYRQPAWFVSQLLPLFRKLPVTWSELILPLPQAQGKTSVSILSYYCAIQDYLTDTPSVNVLKNIITQRGVRALDIMSGLIHPGLVERQIINLAGEAECLFSYLDDIPFNDLNFYKQYAMIFKDLSLTPIAKKEKAQALKKDFTRISQAIRTGSVPPELETHPLFFPLLGYTFPAAYSVDSRAYADLYQSFPDLSQHLVENSKNLNSTFESVFLFSQGRHVIADGLQIQTEPWDFLVESVKSSAADKAPPNLPELGESIFQIWTQNTMTAESKVKLTAQIYQLTEHKVEFSTADLQNPDILLKLKSFLEDSCREILQAALGELYAQEPDRFLNQARHKIIPVKRVEKGLAKSIRRTRAEFREKRLEKELAQERLVKQLKGFDLTGSQTIEVILNSTDDALIEILNQLKPEIRDVNPTQVFIRVHQDFYGENIARMKRELFGDGSAPSKLKFETSGGVEKLELRFQATKHKAHSPIGFCEGVCTARDFQLWNHTHFAQTVFWGPGDQAVGGMHLLIVEHEGARYLSLPGINPSNSLLKRVGINEILSRVFQFSHQVAKEWNLSGVWIPTSTSIFSNRVDVLDAVIKMNLPKKTIPNTNFSYSPYRYTFSEVYEVPAVEG